MSDLHRKITRKWLLHLGYTPEAVDALPDTTEHEVYGCEPSAQGYDCADENGASRHPLSSEADETAEIVGFVLNAAADAIQALHPGEVKNSVIFLRGQGADPACACVMGWQCDFCRQFARGYNGDLRNTPPTPERSVLSKTIARMIDLCPGCGRIVVGEQAVARPGPAWRWFHAECFDATHTPADPGYDETRHDHSHEYEADLRGDDDVRWDA